VESVYQTEGIVFGLVGVEVFFGGHFIVFEVVAGLGYDGVEVAGVEIVFGVFYLVFVFGSAVLLFVEVPGVGEGDE
jgi:hypothetical protein